MASKPKTPELLMKDLILKGTGTKDILVALNKAFPKANQTFTSRLVSYNRTFLRKLGFVVERSGRSDKGRVRGPNVATTSKPAAKKKIVKKKAAVKKKAPAKKKVAKKKVAVKKKAPAKRKKITGKKKPATRKISRRSKVGVKKKKRKAAK
jgi:hypothetical protein